MLDKCYVSLWFSIFFFTLFEYVLDSLMLVKLLDNLSVKFLKCVESNNTIKFHFYFIHLEFWWKKLVSTFNFCVLLCLTCWRMSHKYMQRSPRLSSCDCYTCTTVYENNVDFLLLLLIFLKGMLDHMNIFYALIKNQVYYW